MKIIWTEFPSSCWQRSSVSQYPNNPYSFPPRPISHIKPRIQHHHLKSTAITLPKSPHHHSSLSFSSSATGDDTNNSPANSLRLLLRSPGIHLGPACFDALSAKLVEQAGFDFCFTTGNLLYLLLIHSSFCRRQTLAAN